MQQINVSKKNKKFLAIWRIFWLVGVIMYGINCLAKLSPDFLYTSSPEKILLIFLFFVIWIGLVGLFALRVWQIFHPLLQYSVEKLYWLGGFAYWKDIDSIKMDVIGKYIGTTPIQIGETVIVVSAKPGCFLKSWGFQWQSKQIDVRNFCTDEETQEIVQQLKEYLSKYNQRTMFGH